MLFILVMEVLDAIIHKADALLVLRRLEPWAIMFWMALYTDDLMLFVCPEARDLKPERLAGVTLNQSMPDRLV
jgi:hypothetical protein